MLGGCLIHPLSEALRKTVSTASSVERLPKEWTAFMISERFLGDTVSVITRESWYERSLSLGSSQGEFDLNQESLFRRS